MWLVQTRYQLWPCSTWSLRGTRICIHGIVATARASLWFILLCPLASRGSPGSRRSSLHDIPSKVWRGTSHSIPPAQVPKYSVQIFGSAASGSFLLVLAIDLTLNKQSGMSIGLLLLLDQNGSHVTELQKAGYKPTLSTIILAGVGIAAMYVPSPPSLSFFPSQLARRPVISLTQYLIWKEPFSRTATSLREYQISMHGKPIDIPPEVELPMVPGGKPFAPFNVIGIPMRASEAFDRPMRKEPPLGPSAQGLSAQGLPANSRFSHQ